MCVQQIGDEIVLARIGLAVVELGPEETEDLHPVLEPNLRIQIDCFHLQISEGDVTRRLREYLPRCGHVQIAGVPDRHEPDAGELRYEHVFALLDQLGYGGWVGCEYIPAGETVAGLGWFRRATA